jgi:hypothetical protein
MINDPIVCMLRLGSQGKFPFPTEIISRSILEAGILELEASFPACGETTATSNSVERACTAKM